MSQGHQRSAKGPNVRGRARSYSLVIVGLATFVIAIGFLLVNWFGEKPAPSTPKAENPENAAEEPVVMTPVEETIPKAPSRQSVAQRYALPTQSAETQPTPTVTAQVQPPVSPALQQLITKIVQTGADSKTLTPQGATEWRQSLKELAGQGDSAVPAIREFLAKSQDVSFAGPAAQAIVGYPTLRAGLFDTLAQIGGPSAMQLLTETLQSTADPTDIAALAKTLEQQAPGQYRQDVVNAARETLNQIARGQLNVSDAGPLFTVLQSYGDGAVAPDLAATISKWPYYATFTLAQLPDGQGIPALVQQLQNPDGAGTESRNLALRMLAQQAAQYPDAAAALLEQARQSQFSDRTWKQIATGLAGDQYMLPTDPSLAIPGASTLPGLKTYHMQQGNQNFISLPVADNALISQRLDLVNQLLGATSNPTAVAALQSAKDTLTSRGAR